MNLKSINKLRGWQSNHAMSTAANRELNRIVAEIREEHATQLEDAINEAHMAGERNGVKQARSQSEDYRHGKLDALAEIEKTHIRAPRDSEGVPILLGDGIEYVDGDGRKHHGKVSSIYLGEVMPGLVVDISESQYTRIMLTEIKDARVVHINLPTVEDVLAETIYEAMKMAAFDEGHTAASAADWAVAELTPKLRLAEELAGDAE